MELGDADLELPATRSKRSPIIAAAIAATVIKVALAFFTVGTNDATTWEHDVSKLRTAGFAQLYREGVQFSSPSGQVYPKQEFIHPPAVLHGLYALGAIQDTTGLPVQFWLRITCSVADLGTLLLVYLILPRSHPNSLLILLAVSPISILVSGFHANTDPIMIFFLVLCVYFIGRGDQGLAGVVFGVAACVKIVPLLFAPTICLYLPNMRQRTKWATIAAATWLALSMPYIAEQPTLILKTMLGYGSATGLWGFYFLCGVLRKLGTSTPYSLYAPVAKWIAASSVVLAPVLLRVLRSRASLFTQCGLISALFLFVSPGFGLQYLSWTAPWVLVLGFDAAMAYSAVAGTFMLSVYVEASLGTGVRAYADLLTVRHWTMLIVFGLACWWTMGALALRYARLSLNRSPLPKTG